MHSDAENTVRGMVAKCPGKPELVSGGNLVAMHMLGAMLVNTGKYQEAERVEKEVLAYVESRPFLGRDSPQSISARRIVSRAVWGQGVSRRAEAEALVRETMEIVEGMGGGKFAVYQEEERKLLETEIMAILKH